MSLCGKVECGASTGIDGSVTFGSGELDDFGYWEKPCSICATEWERLNPGETAWPFRKIEKGAKAIMKAKVTLTMVVETGEQDKFLRAAMERLITGEYLTISEDVRFVMARQDAELVLRTFKARFGIEHLGVRQAG